MDFYVRKKLKGNSTILPIFIKSLCMTEHLRTAFVKLLLNIRLVYKTNQMLETLQKKKIRKKSTNMPVTFLMALFLFWIAIWPLCWKVTVRLAFR